MTNDCLAAPCEGIADEALDAVIEIDERALDDVTLLALIFLAASHDPGAQFGFAR